MFLYPALFTSIHCSYAEISARDAAVLSSLCTYPIRNIKLFSERYCFALLGKALSFSLFSKNTSFAVGKPQFDLPTAITFKSACSISFVLLFMIITSEFTRFYNFGKKGIEKGRNTTIKQSYFARKTQPLPLLGKRFSLNATSPHYKTSACFFAIRLLLFNSENRHLAIIRFLRQRFTQNINVCSQSVYIIHPELNNCKNLLVKIYKKKKKHKFRK